MEKHLGALGTAQAFVASAFLEALCELRRDCSNDNFMRLLVPHVPLIHGEQKTKLEQMAIRGVRSAGLIQSHRKSVRRASSFASPFVFTSAVFQGSRRDGMRNEAAIDLTG